MKLNKKTAAMAVIMAVCTLAGAGCNKADTQESNGSAAVTTAEVHPENRPRLHRPPPPKKLPILRTAFHRAGRTPLLLWRRQ